MDIVISFFNSISSYNALAEYMGYLFFIALAATLIFNLDDSQRVWIVGVFFVMIILDIFVVRAFTPQDLIVRQLAYSALDLFVVYMLQKRIVLCDKIFRTFKMKDDGGFVSKVLRDIDSTKQEYAIRTILLIGVAINIAMIIEHCIRHPEFFGLAKSEYNAATFQWLYYSYPFIKLSETALLIIGLISMTIDGLANKLEKSNFMS